MDEERKKKVNEQRLKQIKKYQFKPGCCPNPKGKPKGARNSKTILKLLLEGDVECEDIDGKTKKMSGLNALHLQQIIKAVKDKNTRAYEVILDRLEGKPTQEISQTIKTYLYEDLKDFSDEELDAKLKELDNETNGKKDTN